MYLVGWLLLLLQGLVMLFFGVFGSLLAEGVTAAGRQRLLAVAGERLGERWAHLLAPYVGYEILVASVLWVLVVVIPLRQREPWAWWGLFGAGLVHFAGSWLGYAELAGPGGMPPFLLLALLPLWLLGLALTASRALR